MTHTDGIRWTLAVTLALASPVAIPTHAAQTQPVRIDIPDPGKTGLVPGRYQVELPAQASGAARLRQLTLVADAAPPRRHRYPARATGCEGTGSGSLSWSHKVAPRPDGSLRIEFVAAAAPGCRIVVAIPAVPGIEGSPIGTAGAPQKPGVSGRAGSADRELEQAILKAKQALPRLACASGPADVQARLEPLQSSLRAVAGAASPSAAVAPLRRFDAARQALYKSLAGNRTYAADAGRCRAAEGRCAASGSAGSGCGIDAAVCLARVLCAAQ